MDRTHDNVFILKTCSTWHCHAVHVPAHCMTWLGFDSKWGDCGRRRLGSPPPAGVVTYVPRLAPGMGDVSRPYMHKSADSGNFWIGQMYVRWKPSYINAYELRLTLIVSTSHIKFLSGGCVMCSQMGPRPQSVKDIVDFPWTLGPKDADRTVKK